MHVKERALKGVSANMHIPGSTIWISLVALAAFHLTTLAPAAIQEPHFPSEKEQAAAARVYGALVERLGRIKTLSMRVIHGNFTDAEEGPRTVHFPPPRRPREDDPRTILDCFGGWLNWDRVSHAKYHGEKVTVLEHIPRDGGDGYGILYISDRTGWPVANGYAPDRTTPRMTEFTHLRIRLKRDRTGRKAHGRAARATTNRRILLD
ncbi:MAG: hypothetical protein ACHQ50_09600 [Fimbriimonadales bacterium]